MGFGGGGYFGGIPNQQPAMSAAQINAGMWGNYSPGAAQATANNIYGAGGFGAQPAYYAGLGAAYGRATGGFGGYGAANADPLTPVGGGAIPGGSRSMNLMRGGGIGSDAARAPAQPQPAWSPSPAPDPYAFVSSAPSSGQVGPYGSAFNFQPGSMAGGAIPGGSASMNRMRAGGQNPYAGMILGPMGNPTAYNPGSYAGDQSNYGIPYRGASLPGDIGFTPQSPMPNLGYNPGMQNLFANPAMGGGAFQGRFGMGFPNAGTPSQYAPGAQMPPGFLSPYSVDNPQGALPLGWGNSFNN
jgi:hypothetical protein